MNLVFLGINSLFVIANFMIIMVQRGNYVNNIIEYIGLIILFLLVFNLFYGLNKTKSLELSYDEFASEFFNYIKKELKLYGYEINTMEDLYEIKKLILENKKR